MNTKRKSPAGLRLSISTMLVSLSAVMLLQTPTAMAQSDDYTKFGLSLGVFVTNRNSKTRLDGAAGMRGTEVDLEDNLGLDNSDTVFRIDGYYRFKKKHRLDFSVFDLSRSASILIQRDIEWNDTVYPINSTLDSNFDLAIYKLAYTWSFLQRDKGYLGLTAGVYVARFGTTIAGELIGQRESNDVTVPLPVFGLRGQYDFTQKLSFRASGEIFALEYGDFSGSMYDIYAGLDYQFFKHLAIGVGINSVNIDIGITKDNFNGDLNWQYDGGLLFFKFDF
jgi:hypothetical protein